MPTWLSYVCVCVCHPAGTSFTAPTTLPSPLLERLSLQARQAPDSHTSGTTQDPLLCTPPRRTQGPVQGWARLGQGVDSPSHPDFCPTVALSASTHATNTATRVTPAMSPARQHGGPLALASMAVAQMSPQVLAGVRPPMPRYRRRSIAASDIGSPLRTVDGSPVAAAAAALGETPSPRTVSPVAAARRQPPAAVRVLAELAQHMPSSATRATPTVSSMSQPPQASRSGLACSSTNNANNTYPTDVHSPVGRRPTVACSVYTPDHSVAPAQRCTSLHCTRDAPCALCALGLSSPGGEDDNNGAQYSTVRLQAHSAQGPAVARMPSAATTIAWPSALSDDAGGAGDVLHPLDAAALAALSPPPLEPLERATSGVSLQRRWLSRFRAAGQRSPGDAVAPASGAPAAPEAPPGFQRARSGLSGPRHGVDESAQDEDGGVVFFKSPGTMHVLCALHEFRLPVDLVTWRGALVSLDTHTHTHTHTHMHTRTHALCVPSVVQEAYRMSHRAGLNKTLSTRYTKEDTQKSISYVAQSRVYGRCPITSQAPYSHAATAVEHCTSQPRCYQGQLAVR